MCTTYAAYTEHNKINIIINSLSHYKKITYNTPQQRLQSLRAANPSAVPTRPAKSCNLRKEFFRPGKSWKMTVVMQSHGIPPIVRGIFNRRIID